MDKSPEFIQFALADEVTRIGASSQDQQLGDNDSTRRARQFGKLFAFGLVR